MEKKRIVIIGAGPAGLTAAYELLKNNSNYEVLVLEQEEQIGGISKTVKCGNNLIDTGIHRFFTKNDKIQEIWNELLPVQGCEAYDYKKLDINVELNNQGPNPEEEENVMLIRERITRIFYNKKFFDYPVSLNMNTIRNLGFFQLIIAGFSYLKTCIFKKKEDSLENFYINRFGKKLYSMFFESYTEKVWGRHPSKISADWGSQRAKGLSIVEILRDILKKCFKIKNSNNTETSLIEQFYYPKLGAGQIWEVMANYIIEKGGKILKNSCVEEINIFNDKVKSITYVQNGEEHIIETDILISSMPLKNLVNNIKGINVPQEINRIANGLPYREFMSVGILAKDLNLKNKTSHPTFKNIIPDSWIYIQEPDVKMGRLQVFNNWSPYIFEHKEDIEKNVLLGLEYFCSEDDEYWNMEDKEFINFAIDEAVKIGLLNKEDILETTRIKIKKAYPAYFDTYYEIDKLINYINKFDNLYCIGRNGQHRYNNIDHSMLTGVEVAKNIIKNQKSKENIWNVNTEKEYHEIKKVNYS